MCNFPYNLTLGGANLIFKIRQVKMNSLNAKSKQAEVGQTVPLMTPSRKKQALFLGHAMDKWTTKFSYSYNN